MWSRGFVAFGLLGLSVGCATEPAPDWRVQAYGRVVEVSQYSSDRLDYHFTFASGRSVSATGSLGPPRAAIIVQCAAEKDDVIRLGVTCSDWPERREVILSLLALGYSNIEQACFDDICDETVVVDPSALGINNAEVAEWAKGWPEYIGQGGVYD